MHFHCNGCELSQTIPHGAIAHVDAIETKTVLSKGEEDGVWRK